MTLDYVLIIYFALGVVLGWGAYWLLMQIAYLMDIVEYKVRKQGDKP